MALHIAAAGVYANTAAGTNKTNPSQKPVWNPNKVYRYLEDMNQGFQEYKQQAVSYYSSVIAGQEGDKTRTVDELKQEIQRLFPEYTLTDREPEVTQGKFYLYIDNSQLKKMAEDPKYRAKVYGLMDSELQGKKGFTLQYSDGRNVTQHLTGSVFSLAESNRKYAGPDGIPYRGSCTSDGGFSSSASHVQVRSMSFLYGSIDPAGSTVKNRKANAVESEAKRLAKKRAEKQAEKKKQERKERVKELYTAMCSNANGTRIKNAINKDMESVQTTANTSVSENVREYFRYLREKYTSLQKGIVRISKSFLRECVNDQEKQSKLEEMLGVADNMVENAEENIKGYQGMQIKIDRDGNMETETYSGSVTFNAEKRARQLAAAKTPAQVKAVLALLASDLSDCEAGLAQGMCDENEVQKVKAMIQEAEQKLSQVSAKSPATETKEEELPDSFSLNLLM